GLLDDAALRGEVAPEDAEAAAGLDGRLDREDDVLPLALDDGSRDLTQRATIDSWSVAVDEPLFGELPRDERDTACTVDVGRVVATPRLHVGEHRRLLRHAVEVVDRERDPELVRDREQVEKAVRRAARRHDGGGRVLEGLAGHELRGAEVLSDE